MPASAWPHHVADQRTSSARLADGTTRAMWLNSGQSERYFEIECRITGPSDPGGGAALWSGGVPPPFSLASPSAHLGVIQRSPPVCTSALTAARRRRSRRAPSRCSYATFRSSFLLAAARLACILSIASLNLTSVAFASTASVPACAASSSLSGACGSITGAGRHPSS
jgi:hypothetical protein